jgi:hypothetical protein
MMIVVFVAALVGLVAWMGQLWRRTHPPVWTCLVALVPVGLGAWCVVAMAAALTSANRVPETLSVHEQVRQVAMADARMMRWGMRFWGAGLVAASWLLFVMWRWDASPQSKP